MLWFYIVVVIISDEVLVFNGDIAVSRGMLMRGLGRGFPWKRNRAAQKTYHNTSGFADFAKHANIIGRRSNTSLMGK